MRKVLLLSALALLAFAPLAANQLYGFGFTFGGDIVHQAADSVANPDTVYSGIGFNADVYIGQRLGFYAGAAFGLLTGIHNDGNADMADYSLKFFGNALVGLGAFFPIKTFDISGAIGLGLDFVSTRLSDGPDTNNLFSVGPGVSISLGVPVSTKVEAYVACRLLYGMILMGEFPDFYQYDFSFTPAIGVRIKA